MESSGHRAASRGRSLVLLLVVSLLLTGGLAWQAVDAVRSHQEVAANVLRDYAMLAAGEFVRRSANQVGYYGYYPMSVALASSDPTRVLPSPEQISAGAEDRLRDAAALARYSFRWDPVSGDLQFAPAGPPEGLGARLGQLLREARPDEGGAYDVIHGMFEGSLHSFVVGPAGAEGSGSFRLVGFEVNYEALGPWLRQSIERAPLLPPSLAKGDETNSFLTVVLTDPEGRELYRYGEERYSYYFVERPFGDSYQGVFDGCTVHAAVDPAAAPDLAIGGLPRSRLPLLLGIILLTSGLLVTAILQLRRERAVAQMRSDFVSRVSHELRTPLTQIRMFGETLLLDRVRSEDERRRSLEIIDREARRLSNLVENILQFSRSERGAIRLTRRNRSLAPLMRELLEEFEPLADSDGARVEIEALADPTVYVDEEAFRQIVFNLLDNAIKYGPRGQTIRVGVSLADGFARVSVEDDGPGVPKGERERVWQRFHRIERDRTSAVAGTGIGLSVVRELTMLHGGDCRVEEGRGGGARFVVEIPIVETREAVAPTAAKLAGGAAE